MAATIQSRAMLGLKSETDPAWTEVALRDETALLRDHAHLERKAAGHVVTLIGQVPYAAERLLEIVREELDHFELVSALLAKRGKELGTDPGNPYVQRVAKIANKGVLDRILRMGIIEARSYERFSLLAERATGDLQALFAGLKESEAGHHAFFSKLAYEKWPREEVRTRWEALATAEAEIVTNLKWGPRIH